MLISSSGSRNLSMTLKLCFICVASFSEIFGLTTFDGSTSMSILQSVLARCKKKNNKKRLIPLEPFSHLCCKASFATKRFVGSGSRRCRTKSSAINRVSVVYKKTFCVVNRF